MTDYQQHLTPIHARYAELVKQAEMMLTAYPEDLEFAKGEFALFQAAVTKIDFGLHPALVTEDASATILDTPAEQHSRDYRAGMLSALCQIAALVDRMA